MTQNDSFDEVDQENFVVRLSSQNPTSIGYLNQQATVNVNDNDAEPEISFGTLPTITEGNTLTSTVRIPVRLNSQSNKEVTVNFAVTAITAELTHDYTVITDPTRLTFVAQDQEEFIEVSIVGDIYFEDNETFKVALSGANNATIATAAMTGVSLAINNDDDAPVISISSTEVTEGTVSGGNFIVTQTPGSGKTVSVTLTVTDITATMGTNSDYAITLAGFTGNSGTIEFTGSDSPEALVSKSIPFTIRDDSDSESTETFSITLSDPNPTGDATIDADSKVGTGTIYDNDTAPTLTIAADSAEIDESTDASFTVTANVIPPSGFNFKYEVSQEGDFLATSVNTTEPQSFTRSFTGSRDNYTAPLVLTIDDDQEGNPTGSVTVTLLPKDVNTSNYTLGSNAKAKVTVFDDDLPELSIVGVAGPVVEGSGDKAQFTITSQFEIGIISLRYRPSNTGGNFLVGDIAGTDQEIDINFNNTKTATLELDIDNDEVVEEDGTVQVLLLDDVFEAEVPASTILGTPRIPAKPIQYTVVDDETKDFGSVVVQDDDTLPNNPVITLQSEYLPTGATTATYYVVANPAPTKDLEVTLEYNYKATDPENAGTTIELFPNWFRTTVTISANNTYESFSQNTEFSAPHRINAFPFLVTVTGALSVRLVDGDNYDLGNPSSSDLPTAANADNPLVSISPVGDGRVVESSELRFVVTANPAPAAPVNPSDPVSIPVTIFITQTGDFISEDLTSGRLVKSVMIPKTGVNLGRAEFTVGLDDDEVEETSDGTVTATVQAGTGFVLGNFTKTATVTIYDDDTLPVVTIANSNPVAEDAGRGDVYIDRWCYSKYRFGCCIYRSERSR